MEVKNVDLRIPLLLLRGGINGGGGGGGIIEVVATPPATFEEGNFVHSVSAAGVVIEKRVRRNLQ